MTATTTVVPTRSATTRATSSSGLRTMLAIQLRTGWKPIAIWVVSIIGTYLFTIAAVDAAYPDAASLQTYGAAIAGSAAIAAINGTPYGATNLGGVTANEFGFMASIMFPVMATHLIARATRTQEASGLLELVRSRSVARWAPTAAAIVTTATATLVIAAGIFVSATAFGIDPDDAALYALSLLGLGLVWTGIASSLAQLVRRPGTVYSASLILLGTAYATRAIGDVRDNGWKWLSPLAWQQETRPFATDARWWPLLLAFGVATILLATAVTNSATRDLGSGLLPTRAGPTRAARHTRSTLGLAFSQQRAAIAAWTAGGLAIAVVFGALAGDVAEVVASNPAVAGYEGTPGDVYLGLTLVIVALMASGYAIQSLSKLRGAELDGSLEPTLARPVSRPAWLGAHLAIITGGFVIMTMLSALALGVAADQGGTGNEIGRIVGAGASYLPAIAVIAAVGVALFGWLPRLQPAIWLLLGYSAFIAFVGRSLNVDEWVLRLSPLYSVGLVPAEDPSATALTTLTAIAILVGGLGIIGFRQRDIPIR